MKLHIIGASREGGLGNYLAQYFASDYDVETFSRNKKWNVDADIIILTLFDHRLYLLQEAVFRVIFEKIRKQDKHLVIVGSMAHHYMNTRYADAKKSLNERFYELCKHREQYTPKVLLIEPGSLEKVRGVVPSGPFLLYAEIANIIKCSINMNPKFLHVAVSGINT
jgi:hypothetical protein